METKCKLVMLPSNKKATIKSDLAINENNLLFQPSKLEGTWFFLNKFQHLYIISDEEIKEGDWYMNNSIIFKADGKFDEGNNPNQNRNNKKIIATTDNFLKLACSTPHRCHTNSNPKCDCRLPQPSQSFINVFVKEYNKGNIITEVMVEYWAHTEEDIQYKINPKDNTITIRKIKDSWSRREVIELIQKYNSDFKVFQDNEKWIEENL